MALTNIQRQLIDCIADNNFCKAKQCAQIILEKQKDDVWKEKTLEKLDTKHIVELPYNVQELLRLETPDMFLPNRHYLNDAQMAIVDKVLTHQQVCERLSELKIIHPNTIMLYGEPGTGKTQLARRIAYELDLPLLFVDFSGLVDSLLGGTNKNIKRIFDFVSSTECVLMIDEVDAISLSRGQSNDVKEAERIVIGLMQEMDKLTSNQILIAATNRPDKLDDAFLRRFTLKFEVKRFNNLEDRKKMVQAFFEDIQIPITVDELGDLALDSRTQSDIYQAMIDFIIQKLSCTETNC